jgi:hypothetical protein
MRKLAIVMILMFAASAAAQQSGESYTYFQAGRPIGEETVRFFEFGDTLIIDSYTRIDLPSLREHRARTVVMAPEDELHDYLYWVASGDTVRAWNTGRELCSWRLTQKQPGDTCIALGHRKAILMESGVAHQLWLLARQFARDPSGRQEIVALIPQSLSSSDLRREGATTRQAVYEGEPITVQRHPFTCGGLYQELEIDAQGNFYRLSLPIRDFELRRANYDPLDAIAEISSQPEEAVEVEGGGPTLPGLLTLPAEGEGPYPALVFLHDSGQVDRDLTFGTNKIFKQLAQGLAERGIASLRYDKRTLIISRQEESPDESRVRSRYGREISLNEAVLDDGRAAYAMLAADPRFRGDGLFILGHGLGGAASATLSLRLEREDMGPAGLIMLAPIGRDLMAVLMEMYRFLSGLGLARSELIEQYEAQIERYDMGRVGEDELILFAAPRYWDSVIYWKPWQDYAEQPAPALILFGERDFMVREADRETWARTFADHPRRGNRLYLKPDLNHLFLSGEGPIGPEEYGKPGRLSDELLDQIAAWIGARLR